MFATNIKVFVTCTVLQLVVPIYWSVDPELNVECFNNYKTEMMCSLISAELNCSQYNLDVSRETLLFSCSLEQISSSVCKCKSQVSNGFVVQEVLTVNVLSGEKTLFTKTFTTEGSIKPDRPVINLVEHTERENFNIFWTTSYEENLLKELIPELTYSITGSNVNETKLLTKGLTSYEIVGENLQSNTNYTVWVRVKCNLSHIFSDYSEPYTFKTSSSIQDILNIIIPILCILLIISISTMFYCYHKILSEWWDKVPTPKIAADFVKQVPNLLSFQNEFSPVHIDSLKPHLNEENKASVSSQSNTTNQSPTLQSLVKDGDSSQVIYAPMIYESLESNSNKHSDLSQKEMSYNREPNTTQFKVQFAGNKYARLKNKTHDKSSTDLLNQKILELPTFQFQSLKALNIRTTHFHNAPFTTQTTLIPENQSITKAIDCSNKFEADATSGQMFLSAWENNPVDSEYKTVQSLSINTREQYNCDMNLSLQLISDIEVDFAYHMV